MLAKHSLKYRSYNQNNGTYYSCNFNRGHFLRIPSLSTRRHICLSTNSSQLGYKTEISSRDPGNAGPDDFTSCSESHHLLGSWPLHHHEKSIHTRDSQFERRPCRDLRLLAIDKFPEICFQDKIALRKYPS